MPPKAQAVPALQGKVAVVTGAGGGIGRYIAMSLGGAGAAVVVSDVNDAGLEETRRLLAIAGIDVMAKKADVTSEIEVAALFAAAAKQFGGIDIIVNNAAIVTHSHVLGPWPNLDDMSKQFFDKVMDVNLGGTFNGSKYGAPYLRARGGGHILNLYGGGPFRPGTGAYAVSKDAIETFNKHSAIELERDNIVVVLVDPGSAIALDDMPAAVKAKYPGVTDLEDMFVQAALLDMTWTGQRVTFPREGAKVLETAGPFKPANRRIVGYDPYALAPPAAPFTLVSDDFSDRGPAPFECYGDDRGKNESPHLRWYNLPEGTQSLVVTAYDADTPIPGGIWHWLVKDIDPAMGELPHGISAAGLPKPAVELKNDLGTTTWSGFRPPPFSGVHHVYFAAYALKVPTWEVDPNLSIPVQHIQLFMSGNVIGRAVLVGTSVAP